MATITKCLNEWNAIVEALGNGKQTILIRNYNTNLTEFLLYPTISYAKDENVLINFKDKYQEFVEHNLLPKSKGKKYEIRYFARVEKIVKSDSKSINAFNTLHIWKKSHVNNFVHGKNPYVWVLRVYKIKNPEFLSRSNGMKYANVNKEIDVSNLTPVISDEEFKKIFKKINRKIIS